MTQRMAINALREWWYHGRKHPTTSKEAAEGIIEALRNEGMMIVPIKPTERMLEELAHIGDGPMISGEECWGYMLAAASTVGELTGSGGKE